MILHYLPLCLTSYESPTCQYAKVGGQHTEKVCPYNTLFGSKGAKEKQAFGPEDRWAELDYHQKKVHGKKSGKQLTPKLWNVAMAWAQKVRRLYFYVCVYFCFVFFVCVFLFLLSIDGLAQSVLTTTTVVVVINQSMVASFRMI